MIEDKKGRKGKMEDGESKLKRVLKGINRDVASALDDNFWPCI